MVRVGVLGDQGLVSSTQDAGVPSSLLSVVLWRARQALVTSLDAVHSLNHFLFLSLISFQASILAKWSIKYKKAILFQIQEKHGGTDYTEKVYLLFST